MPGKAMINKNNQKAVASRDYWRENDQFGTDNKYYANQIRTRQPTLSHANDLAN